MYMTHATGLSQIICQNCQREIVKFARVLQQGKELAKKYNEAIKKSVGRVPIKMTEALCKGFSGVARPEEKKNSALPDPPRIVRRTLIPRQATPKENFEPWPFSSCDLLFHGSQDIALIITVNVKQMALHKLLF